MVMYLQQESYPPKHFKGQVLKYPLFPTQNHSYIHSQLYQTIQKINLSPVLEI